MLQRYEIAMNNQTDRLFIKEYAVLETKSRFRDNYKPIEKDYSLIHEVSYDGSIIHSAIKEGKESLISALRSDDFFPIYTLAEIIAEEVTNLIDGNLGHFSELFFDDRSLISGDDEEN